MNVDWMTSERVLGKEDEEFGTDYKVVRYGTAWTGNRLMATNKRRHNTASAVDSSGYLGDCAFLVAAAWAWNRLLPETRACSSLLTFRRETKSHLFCQSYGWLGVVHSDHQQTTALSCTTVLDIDFVKCPRNYNPDIFSSSSSNSFTALIPTWVPSAASIRFIKLTDRTWLQWIIA